MSFVPVTFGGENVTPKNDGGLYQARYGDGIIWGCGMSLIGTPYTDLQISIGEMMIGGRVIAVDGATNVDLTSIANTTNYVQVKGIITLGNSPVFDTVLVESATTSFPSLTQEDINNNGTTYEVELAIIAASSGAPTSIYSTMFYSSARAISPTAEIGIAPSDTTNNGFIYGAGGNLIIRPNGRFDASGQSYFDAGGDFHLGGEQIGGHTFLYDTGTSRTCASGVTYDLATLSVDSSGVYLVWGSLQYTLASNTSSYPRLGFGTASKTMLYGTTFYSATTASKYASVSALLSPSSATIYLIFYGSSSINIDVSDIRIRAIRLG